MTNDDSAGKCRFPMTTLECREFAGEIRTATAVDLVRHQRRHASLVRLGMISTEAAEMLAAELERRRYVLRPALKLVRNA